MMPRPELTTPVWRVRLPAGVEPLKLDRAKTIAARLWKACLLKYVAIGWSDAQRRIGSSSSHWCFAVAIFGDPVGAYRDLMLFCFPIMRNLARGCISRNVFLADALHAHRSPVSRRTAQVNYRKDTI